MPCTMLLLSGILVLLELPTILTQCPDYANNPSYYFGNCYETRYTAKTWIEAKRYCEKESNGRLAQTSSLRTPNGGVYMYSGYQQRWTGGYSNHSQQTPVTPVTTSPADAEVTTHPTTSAAVTSQHISHSTETTQPPNISSVWYWSDARGDTVIPSTELPWLSGEPNLNNRSRSCLSLNYGGYSAQKCTQSLQFTCEYLCQTRINDGNITTIKTVNYPAFYSSNMDCEWFIDVKVGYAILEFEDFVTEEPSSSECTLDYLTVYETKDSTEPLTTLCGTASTVRVVSPSQHLYLRFVSDSSVSNKGFEATVVSSEAQDIRHLGGEHGVVTSRNFPLNYAKNSTMIWVITVPEGLVNLNFTEFELQPGSTAEICDHDYLEIRDGSEQGPLIGKYCGSTLPPAIMSNSSVLWLTLTADNDVEKSGFRAVYWSDFATCVHIITSTGDVFTSPGHPGNYPPNLQCVWYIDVMEGVALINFTSMRMQYSSGCRADSIEIRDGIQNDGTVIGKYCQSYSRPINMTFESRYATVFFKTDSTSGSSGFRAEFRSSKNCSSTLIGIKGKITSPNYPNEYEPYSNCTWLIDVLNGNATLLIKSFDLQYHEACTYDKLEIYDGAATNATKIGSFCGDTNPGQIHATSRYMLVQLTTDGSSGGIGFSGDFWTSKLQCLQFKEMEQTLKFDGICYGFTRKRYSTLAAAQEVCTSMNASLVYFYSRGEYNAVKKWIYDDLNTNTYYSIWTSAYLGVDWQWSLPAGDVKFVSTFSANHLWAIGEPGSSDQYAQMTSRGLKGVSGNYNSGYVLCKELTPLPSSTTPGPAGNCSPPPNIRSGYYSPPQLTYINGASITFGCDPEHELEGEKTMKCVNGVWQSPHFPVCKSLADLQVDKNACTLPAAVLYASLSPRYPVYTNGSVVRYECFSGYELSSKDHQTQLCLNGHWQRAIPSCTDVTKVAERKDQTTSKSKHSGAVLGSTITIIVVLVVVIVAGVVWFFIKYRPGSNRGRLLEMQ